MLKYLELSDTIKDHLAKENKMLKLAVGKKYKNKAGEIFNIDTYDRKGKWYTSREGWYFWENGEHIAKFLCPLVEEVKENFAITELGDYITRSGKKVTVWGINPFANTQPIYGNIIDMEGYTCWNVNGGYFPTKISNYDIIGKWVEPKKLTEREAIINEINSYGLYPYSDNSSVASLLLRIVNLIKE